MWYQLSSNDVLQQLRSDSTHGLSHQEAQRRLTKYGPNSLPSSKKPSLFLKFIAQFQNILVLILIAATLVSYFLGEILDAIAISAIVLVNAVIGFSQEAQAEKTLESLKAAEIQQALVLREGQIEKIRTTDLVPGDILILEEGAKIAADARVVESFSLRVDESILTGESIPVNKNLDQLKTAVVVLADRTNMVYKDTQTVAGRGKAIVVATGANTEIGKIAGFLTETKSEKTPLTVQLAKVGSMLTKVIAIIAIIIFIVNIARDVDLVDSLLISISLSVAAIPEGLPAIVALVLSMGVKRLAAKKSIVKKLPAVETLGAVRVIATDKTGTLTQNKMNATKIILADGSEFNIEGIGFQTEGKFLDKDKKIIDPSKYPQLVNFLKAAVFANDAALEQDQNSTSILGDTTEGALLVAAARAKLSILEIRSANPIVFELPFTSEAKMMSVIVQPTKTDDYILAAKGAPEVILELCNLDAKAKKMVLKRVQELSHMGLRSLVLASKKLSTRAAKLTLAEKKIDFTNLTYLGLILMQDPLRPDVKKAILAAKQAGIRTIMITGDHKETAAAIAQQAGIINKGETVLTEDDLTKLTNKALEQQLKSGVNVFARISPLGKLRIIEVIKKLPNTQIAVTGDGVNDAPALKASHIGIAMGISGTDITREVADIVITDDNYATIVDAIREGRIIFANLVKFIRYLISCNLSEVIVVAAGVLFGTPIPLLPIQILWINLITDGLPALALGVDPPEYDVMKVPPRDVTVGILHKTRMTYMMIEGTIIGASVFALFIIGLNQFSYGHAQTMTFTALALAQLVHAFNNRSSRKSIFALGIFSNKYLVAAVVLSTILQFYVVQSNWGNLVFKTSTLAYNHWLLVGIVVLITFLVSEIKKQLRFRVIP